MRFICKNQNLQKLNHKIRGWALYGGKLQAEFDIILQLLTTTTVNGNLNDNLKR